MMYLAEEMNEIEADLENVLANEEIQNEAIENSIPDHTLEEATLNSFPV